MSKKRVVAAMSGGVDSSTTAHLLKEAGYEVTGAHMILSDNVSESNIRDLEKTCEIIGIPFYKLDFKKEFKNSVIDYFCREYAEGRTPNPCVVCNKHIKFGLLLRWAKDNGADFLATGHYARIESGGGTYRLLKAIHKKEDQSYFLYRLGQDVLRHLILPMGVWKKDDVRNLATSLGLPAGDKPKSEDLCFIPDKDYRSFVTSRVPSRAGDIVDRYGVLLGSHERLIRYTVGQRQHLGLSSGNRLYVLELDVAKNRLVVGTKDELLSRAALVRELSWVSGEAPEDLTNITAKVRYRSPDIPVRLNLGDDFVLAEFTESRVAVTPGQSMVFYQGDRVLGGGVIAGRAELKESDFSTKH